MLNTHNQKVLVMSENKYMTKQEYRRRKYELTIKRSRKIKRLKDLIDSVNHQYHEDLYKLEQEHEQANAD